MNNETMKKEEDSPVSDNVVSAEKNSNDSVPATVETSETMNSENEAAVEDGAKEEKALKPGAQLAAFRKAAGIEQEQVAASLKMTLQQVRELEADNYERLHGIAISRGFVRAYAKMLQVDPEPLVAMFAKEDKSTLDHIHKAKPADEFVQTRQPFGKNRKNSKKIWLILILVLIAVIYGAYSMKWFFSGSSSMKKSSKKETAVEVKKAASKPKEVKAELAKPLPENPVEKEVKEIKSVPEQEKTAEAAKPEEVKAPTPLPPKKEETVVKDQTAAPVTPVAKPDFLVVRFSGPSHIKLLKTDGSVFREFDGKTGDAEKIEIKEPITLVIEKALHVQAEFRDHPLLLRTARKSPQAIVELK